MCLGLLTLFSKMNVGGADVVFVPARPIISTSAVFHSFYFN